MRWCAGGVIAALMLSACARAPRTVAPRSAPPAAPSPRPSAAALQALVPLPAIVEPAGGDFTIGAGTAVFTSSSDPAVQRAARQVAEWIRRSTGIAAPVTS